MHALANQIRPLIKRANDPSKQRSGFAQLNKLVVAFKVISILSLPPPNVAPKNSPGGGWEGRFSGISLARCLPPVSDDWVGFPSWVPVG